MRKEEQEEEEKKDEEEGAEAGMGRCREGGEGKDWEVDGEEGAWEHGSMGAGEQGREWGRRQGVCVVCVVGAVCVKDRIESKQMWWKGGGREPGPSFDQGWNFVRGSSTKMRL